MNVTQLTDSIYYLGVNDTQTQLFESLWPIPQGITYNCYLINDQKTALIDTVEKKFNQELLDTVSNILKDKPLDYLIINHMEPDHSGTVVELKKRYPQLTIVGNHKTIEFAQGFYDLPANQIKEVQTESLLSLGEHELKFVQTPMLHWPESMVSYETSTNTLFSSDIFGGFKAVDKQPLADQRQDLEQYLEQARQYFATVLGAYTRPAKKTLQLLSTYKIKIIAPAHGLVWQNKAGEIFKLYQNWAEMQAESGVTIIIGSMYGFTQQMAKLIQQKLKTKNIPVTLLNAAETDLAEQLNAVWLNQGLIIGSCTYNNGLFPPIKQLLDALQERKIANRYLGIFSSYSWTGGAMKQLKEFAEQSKLDLVEPVFETQYKMNQTSQAQAVELATNIGDKIAK